MLLWFSFHSCNSTVSPNGTYYLARSIPTFVIVWLCCRLKGAKFVIDWHNLGYSILALSLGAGHPLVKVRLHGLSQIRSCSIVTSKRGVLWRCSLRHGLSVSLDGKQMRTCVSPK